MSTVVMNENPNKNTTNSTSRSNEKNGSVYIFHDNETVRSGDWGSKSATRRALKAQWILKLSWSGGNYETGLIETFNGAIGDRPVMILSHYAQINVYTWQHAVYLSNSRLPVLSTLSFRLSPFQWVLCAMNILVKSIQTF